jgi:trk system potassium uptake protein TrkH
MNWTVVQRILGLLLMMFSLTMLPPILFSLYYNDHSWLPFVQGFGLTLAAGFICWLPVHRSKKDLRLRDGFLVVASFWTVLGTFGAAPLFFSDVLSLTFTDAVFESMSGLTTTGATVLTGLDDLPVSIQYYRQQLQWLGGMGWFDALCHSFSTVAIGGFSTHDASIAHFDSAMVDLIAVFFMFVAGINFSLHFFAWRYVSIKHYFQDQEFRAYSFMLLVLSGVVIGSLFMYRGFEQPLDTFLDGLFQSVSIATTTGFTTENFAVWPAALPVLLIFASFIGGSAGSTAGGIKVIRWLLVYKQGVREIARLVHPSAEIPVKLGNKAVSSRVVEAVWGFFSVYIVVFGAMMLAMMFTGLDQVTAFSAVAATLNNLGPGLGGVASGFMDLNDMAKWISVVGMLLGRLEIFTLLVLITPTFWRT